MLLAVAMAFAMVIPALASSVPPADEPAAAPTGSITIKLPTQSTAPSQPTTYKIYKVFDATVNANDNTKISYRLCSGDSLSAAMIAAGFSVDTQGNVSGPDSLNDAAIAAIAAYVTSGDLVATLVSSVGDLTVTSEALPYGYYYITTTTGTVVTIDSNNNTPTVDDKNVIPPVVKSPGTQYDANSLKAIAAVGTDQPYTAVITKTAGAVDLVFTDTMTNQTYNGDLVVTVGGATVSPSNSVNTSAANETFKVSGAQGDSSFTVTFDNDYIAGLADNTQITLNYSAEIKSAALNVNPATNTASLNSGNNHNTTSDTTETYNATITVDKKDGDGKALDGAGFILSKTVPDESAGAAQGATKTVYYKLANGTITWVDSKDDASEYVTAITTTTDPGTGNNVSVAQVSFTGLGAGTYTLIEKTVPNGFNKAPDQTITISDSDFTAANLSLVANVTNNSGSELPSTGGIGTTIFTIVGIVLILGAGIALVARRRMSAAK